MLDMLSAAELLSVLDGITPLFSCSSTIPRQLAYALFALYVELSDEFDLLTLEPRDLLMVVANYEDALVRIFPTKRVVLETDDPIMLAVDALALQIKEIELDFAVRDIRQAITRMLDCGRA